MSQSIERPGVEAGSGVVLSTEAQRIRNMVVKHQITSTQAQELYNSFLRCVQERESLCPNFPWHTNTAELEKLQQEARSLNQQKLAH